jgi:hypothetical protein
MKGLYHTCSLSGLGNSDSSITDVIRQVLKALMGYKQYQYR